MLRINARLAITSHSGRVPFGGRVVGDTRLLKTASAGDVLVSNRLAAAGADFSSDLSARSIAVDNTLPPPDPWAIPAFDIYPTMSGTKPHKYKMADLVHKTGVSREAIRFYISTGLLPPPTKTSRNMAWYTDAHVEMLDTIRTLQNDQFLPLKAIKSILHGAPEYDFSERQAEIISNLRGKLSNANGDATQPGHGSTSPVPKSDIGQLQELGWISAPAEEQTAEDREIIALWAELRDNGVADLPGVGPRNVNYVLEAVDFLFDRELDFFREHLSGLPPEQSLEFVRRGYVIVNRLFALLHGRRVTMLGKRLADREMLAAKKVARTSKSARKPSAGMAKRPK